MKLVLCDVDGTLLRGPSCELSFAFFLLRTRIVRARHVRAWIAFLVRHWARYGRQVLRKDKAYLAGLECEPIRALARAYVPRHLAPRLCRELLARLAAHHEAGDPLVLLSGAPDFLVVPLAELVRASAHCAAIHAVCDGHFTAQAPVQHPFGPDKLRFARMLCDQWGARLADVVAYADSRTDLALLRAVGHPVAVNADRGLRAVARASGWEVLACRP